MYVSLLVRAILASNYFYEWRCAEPLKLLNQSKRGVFDAILWLDIKRMYSEYWCALNHSSIEQLLSKSIGGHSLKNFLNNNDTSGENDEAKPMKSWMLTNIANTLLRYIESSIR